MALVLTFQLSSVRTVWDYLTLSFVIKVLHCLLVPCSLILLHAILHFTYSFLLPLAFQSNFREFSAFLQQLCLVQILNWFLAIHTLTAGLPDSTIHDTRTDGQVVKNTYSSNLISVFVPCYNPIVHLCILQSTFLYRCCLRECWEWGAGWPHSAPLVGNTWNRYQNKIGPSLKHASFFSFAHNRGCGHSLLWHFFRNWCCHFRLRWNFGCQLWTASMAVIS